MCPICYNIAVAINYDLIGFWRNTMLFSLALIPVIIILIFIYKMDKKEKEPAGLLVGLFFAGMGTVISAIILESIGELILAAFLPAETGVFYFIFAMLIVGPAEEMGKWTVLRLITWKNRSFNYSYDAIVYSVFVSLGFAALENIAYVFGSGLGTALMRMFTAVPGHASFAVLMGYFYSKAKYAELSNDQSAYKKYNALSMIVPIIGHGIYDAVILSGSTSESLLVIGSALLGWIVYVIVLFAISIIAIVMASKNDFCIAYYPQNVQAIYMPQMAGSWVCNCGVTNMLNFCARCGQMRPVVDMWYCPVCGSPTAYNFCARCGNPKPQAPAPGPVQMDPPSVYM